MEDNKAVDINKAVEIKTTATTKGKIIFLCLWVLLIDVVVMKKHQKNSLV